MKNSLKRPARMKYLLVLLATIVIFVFGLLLGSWTSTQKLQDVRTLQDDLRTQTLDAETQYQLIQEDPCVFGETAPLTSELYDLSLRLDFMENLLGPKDVRVVGMKSYYSLLELRHWLFLKRLQTECGRNQTLVLYFYSNGREACPLCEEQGFILTWLRKNYPDVQVFSFDVDLGLNALATLKHQYAVNETPFLVIDERPHPGFQSKNALLFTLFNESSGEKVAALLRNATG